MAQQLYRTNLPSLTKCKNLECNNLISDVNQKTRIKEYCSDSCRNKANTLKKKKKREYVKSQRYDKKIVKPLWIKCSCGGNMLPLCADTTRNGSRHHYKVPIRFCNICKIVKLLEPMEVLQ